MGLGFRVWFIADSMLRGSTGAPSIHLDSPVGILLRGSIRVL